MAYTYGDWIPVRLDLRDSPEIIQMAESLDCHVDQIVGHCIHLWSWISRNTDGGGSWSGFSVQSFSKVLGVPGFVEAMIETGWLAYDASNKRFRVSKPDRWLSSAAKKRLQEREKKRKQRGRLSRHGRDKQGTSRGQNGDMSPSASFEKEKECLRHSFKSAGKASGDRGAAEAFRRTSISREEAYQRAILAAVKTGNREAADQLRAEGPDSELVEQFANYVAESVQ